MSGSSRRACALLLLLSAGPLTAQWGGQPPVPPTVNPSTPDKKKLGKTLFWDEQLSSTQQTACGTCHSVGGADARSAVHPGPDAVFGTDDDSKGSPGVVGTTLFGQFIFDPRFRYSPRVTPRKAPSMINATLNSRQFWDARTDDKLIDPLTGQVVISSGASLEAQALGPILNTTEMGHLGRTWNDVISRLESVVPLGLSEDPGDELKTWIDGRSYKALFRDAFGTPVITPTRIAMAIAVYERELISDQTPLDRFLDGDLNALTVTQRAGHDLFTGKARCTVCHEEPGLATEQFRNIGLRPASEDIGASLWSNLPGAMGAFKVPSLRNVGLRSPYFHSGAFDTLEEVVDFYDRGGDFHDFQTPLIKKLFLTDLQKTQLVDFLRNGLIDPRVEDGLPPFDRPSLFSESALAPKLVGEGTAGTGSAPRMVMVDPPVLGNKHMTIAVDGGFGGMPVVLGISTALSSHVTSGVTMHLDESTIVAFINAGILKGTGFNAGYTSIRFKVPHNPSLDGLEFAAQWFSADPYAPVGVAASEAVRFQLFKPGKAYGP